MAILHQASAGTVVLIACHFLTRAVAMNTPSPNEAIPKPECVSNNTVHVRYAATTKRMYLESNTSTRGGCISLEEIWDRRGGKAPLYAVDPVTDEITNVTTGTWLLTEDLYVMDGITLEVWGSSIGGYADELRLLSTNETFVNVRGHGGSLDFWGTKVISWDWYSNSPDVDETDGRSYISAVSEVIVDANETCEGVAKHNRGEARMDIVDSEIAYLGYHDSESYGLTWKIFDHVNVYGNMYNSDIHHLNFGLYTYGHQQGDWRNNTMHDNSAYGFDPHDDSDYVTIHDNLVYNNGNHGIIASKRCDGVSIQGNEVYGGSNISAGIFLHRSSDNATVMGNYVHDNGDAGIAFLESFHARVENNTFENNKYGVRMSVGSGNNVFVDNIFYNASKYNVFTYLGSDLPDVVESGRSQDNILSRNVFYGSAETIKLKESDGTQFLDNTFEEATVVRVDNATGVLMLGNEGLEDAELKIMNGGCFDPMSDEAFEPVC